MLVFNLVKKQTGAGSGRRRGRDRDRDTGSIGDDLLGEGREAGPGKQNADEIQRVGRTHDGALALIRLAAHSPDRLHRLRQRKLFTHQASHDQHDAHDLDCAHLVSSCGETRTPAGGAPGRASHNRNREHPDRAAQCPAASKHSRVATGAFDLG